MKAAGRDVKEEISQNELWKFLSDNPLRDFAKRSIPLGKDGSFPYLLPRSFAGKTREGGAPCDFINGLRPAAWVVLFSVCRRGRPRSRVSERNRASATKRRQTPPN